MRSLSGRAAASSPWLLLVLFLALAAAKAWVCDDAFITLRSVDNLRHGLGPRWNAAERVQTFTHPLWMLALTATTTVTREDYHSTMLLGLLVSGIMAVVLVRRVARSASGAAAAATILALSSACTDYATSGLENPLAHLCVVWFAAELLASPTPRLRVLALAASLAACTRLDGIVLLAPALAWCAARTPRRAALKALGLGALPLIAWELFAAFYYGSWLPNSAVAKLTSGFGAGILAAHGFGTLVSSFTGDPVGAIAVGGAIFIAWRAVQRARALTPESALGLGIVLHLVTVVLVGGDFMRGRFVTTCIVASAAIVARHNWTRRQAAVWAPACVLLALFAPGGWLHRTDPRASRLERTIDARGIADERAFYAPLTSWRAERGTTPWPDPATAGAVAEARQSWAVDPLVDLCRTIGIVPEGDALPAGAEQAVAAGRLRPVVLAPAVGVYGWYAGPGLHVVDLYGLGDPLLARLPALDPDPLLARFAPRLAALRFRAGHYVRRLPEGYFATLLTGTNHLADPDLAPYWDDVALVTRAPLFAPGRWAALGRVLRGTRDPRLVRARARAAASEPGGGS